MRRLLAVTMVVALAACTRSAGAARGPGDGVVTKVVDGDTIHVRLGHSTETVRLIGIDTPETHRPNTPVECFGKEATKAMRRLLPTGTAVSLQRDAEARDRYGRLLAYVYRSKDRTFVNLEMARTGFAAAYTFPPNVAHADEFVSAAADARDAGRGLWSACGGNHVAAT
jgi:micrococcal nuclease